MAFVSAKTTLLAVVAAAVSVSVRAQSLVGSYRVHDGPSWGSNPPSYTCREACAVVFGGSSSAYQCSTTSSSVNNLAFVSGWGDSQYRSTPVADTFDKSANYNCGSSRCAYSAYVRDHCGNGARNYCFTNVVSTPSPTNVPTAFPTNTPTNTPTESPTNVPTGVPTESPTSHPTDLFLLETAMSGMCAAGITNSDESVCCAANCGSCGGCNCAELGDGRESCCPGAIAQSAIFCVLDTDVGCLLATYVASTPNANCFD